MARQQQTTYTDNLAKAQCPLSPREPLPSRPCSNPVLFLLYGKLGGPVRDADWVLRHCLWI